MNPVAASFLPNTAIDPRQQPPVEQQQQQQEEGGGLDVGIEPGAELGYPGLDGDMRIISREIYQGKTFEDWDDMEGIVRRLARKAGFKVVKVRKRRRKRKRGGVVCFFSTLAVLENTFANSHELDTASGYHVP